VDRDGNAVNIDIKENDMIKATITLALLPLAIAVPVAQAYPPDVVERAVIAHGETLPMERRSTDAGDAAFAAHRRVVAANPSYGRLDPVFASAIRTHRSTAVPAPTATGATTSGFDWNDFGLGAAAMLGLLVSFGGLRKGAKKLQPKHAPALKA
jgi:hypothetical protein